MATTISSNTKDVKRRQIAINTFESHPIHYLQASQELPILHLIQPRIVFMVYSSCNQVKDSAMSCNHVNFSSVVNIFYTSHYLKFV
jgi:hypothetical protein